MEKLIFFVLFMAASAVYNWYIKKKGQSEGEGQNGDSAGRPAAPPARPIRPRPVKATSWEEELRKLLEGETTVTAGTKAATGTAARGRRALCQTNYSAAHPHCTAAGSPAGCSAAGAGRQANSERPGGRRASSCQTARGARSLPATGSTGRPNGDQLVPLRDLAPMAQSKQAYAKAGQLDKVVAAHISKVPTEHVKPTYVVRAGVMPDVVQVAGLFKNFTRRPARR